VLAHLEVAVSAWSPWLQGDKDTLERVQEKAVKMVNGLQDATYQEKGRELGLELLEERKTVRIWLWYISS
jgi:ribonuclease P/MRP protein subunit RPP40